MQKLLTYLKKHKEEESVIAEVFIKTSCINLAKKESYCDYKTDKYTYTYSLLKEEDRRFYYENLYIFKEKDSYLIFSIDTKEYIEDFKPWTNKESFNKLKNSTNKKVITIYSVYSFTKNKKRASKNIEKVLRVAKKSKADIIVDTATEELIHLVNKYNLILARTFDD